MKPVLRGNIVDASCGSGLFARLFAKSELFSLVVALDYSENMLRQCYEFANQEENFPKEYKSAISIEHLLLFAQLLDEFEHIFMHREYDR